MIVQHVQEHYDSHLSAFFASILTLVVEGVNWKSVATSIVAGLALFTLTNLIKWFYFKLYKKSNNS